MWKTVGLGEASSRFLCFLPAVADSPPPVDGLVDDAAAEEVESIDARKCSNSCCWVGGRLCVLPPLFGWLSPELRNAEVGGECLADELPPDLGCAPAYSACDPPRERCCCKEVEDSPEAGEAES